MTSSFTDVLRWWRQLTKCHVSSWNPSVRRMLSTDDNMKLHDNLAGGSAISTLANLYIFTRCRYSISSFHLSWVWPHSARINTAWSVTTRYDLFQTFATKAQPFNPLIATLKPQSNGSSYSNKVQYIWCSEEGPGWAAAPPSPLFAVPNVTAHPSMAKGKR